MSVTNMFYDGKSWQNFIASSEFHGNASRLERDRRQGLKGFLAMALPSNQPLLPSPWAAAPGKHAGWNWLASSRLPVWTVLAAWGLGDASKDGGGRMWEAGEDFNGQLYLGHTQNHSGGRRLWRNNGARIQRDSDSSLKVHKSCRTQNIQREGLLSGLETRWKKTRHSNNQIRGTCCPSDG